MGNVKELGGWYLKFTRVKALSAALDGWTRSFTFLLLYTRVCLLKRGLQRLTATCCNLSLSLSLSLTLLHFVCLSASVLLSLNC